MSPVPAITALRPMVEVTYGSLTRNGIGIAVIRAPCTASSVRTGRPGSTNIRRCLARDARAPVSWAYDVHREEDDHGVGASLRRTRDIRVPSRRRPDAAREGVLGRTPAQRR